MTGRSPGATTGRLAGWLVFVGVLIALNYVSRFAGDTGPGARDFFYRWDTFGAAVIQFTIMALILLWIVHGGPARSLLALRRPSSWGTAAGIMLAVLVAVIVLGGLLSPFLDPGEEQGLVPDEWRPERAAPFAANLAVSAIYVPIVEELIFRGAGVSLMLRFGTAAAILGTGVLFGLAHGLVLALPVLVGFGIGLAWLRTRTASVYPCIVLHGLFNATAVLYGVFR